MRTETTFADWQALAERTLKGAPFDSLRRSGPDGMVLEPLYGTRTDVPIGGMKRNPIIFQRVDSVEAVEDFSGSASLGLDLVLSTSPCAYGWGLEGFDVRVLGRLDLEQVPVRVDAGEASENILQQIQCFIKDNRLDPARVRVINAGQRLADGRAAHLSGASPAEELAQVLYQGVRLLARDMSLHFTLASTQDVFISLCKFRALRRLWSYIETCSKRPVSDILIHAETSYAMLETQDPMQNILRSGLAGFAALAGGADSLTILPHTLSVERPDALAQRLARNIGLILRDEAKVADVADPAAQSGAFEAVTEMLCAAAWPLFQHLCGKDTELCGFAGNQAMFSSGATPDTPQMADLRDHVTDPRHSKGESRS